MAVSFQDQIQTLIALYRQKRFQEILAKGDALVKQYPDAAALHNILGAANAGLGCSEQALHSFSRAVAIEPENAESQNNLGTIFEGRGSLDAAIDSYRKAVQLKPDYTVAHNNLGNVLRQTGRLEEAMASFLKALELKPDYAEAHNNLGVANRALGKLEAAALSYNKAVEIRPDFADAHNNLGNVLKEFGQISEAIACYTQALQINPGYAEAHFNLGTAYREIGKWANAIECFNKALQIRPDFADAHTSLGNTLKRVGSLEEARASIAKAVKLTPDSAEAHSSLGSILKRLGEFDKAIVCYSKALQLNPDHAIAQMQKVQLLAYVCDWNAVDSEKRRLVAPGDSEYAVSPFAMLALEDNPESHRKRSEYYAASSFKTRPLPDIERPEEKPDCLRVGYFSADFKDHPVGRLMAKIFELHDRSRFIIHAYSSTQSTDATLTHRFKKAFDKFHEVNDLTDKEIALLAREEGIDIAVDLSGYTKGSRSDIFAYRVAPIQINYLGYPGTMGATFMDYIIADKILIPPDSQSYYSEKVIYLPHSYQAQDNTMQIAKRIPSREELGLPERGFIFCCFNNSYKISKAEFDIWMRLLARVEGSVLWLYKANEWAKANLLKEAQNRGIDQQRLVFTSGTFHAHADYLARLRLADLFLDTFNYNAGSTASCALWAGVPVLTKQGASYTARMASSLLEAIELPELITATEESYENLALELATNPKKLQSIREKLTTKRDNAPLFDTESFTAHLEIAYQKVYGRYFSGAQP